MAHKRDVTRRSLLQASGAIAAAALPAGTAAGEQAVGPVMAALSSYMSGARDRALPDAVIEKTKHHVLDTFAAMISGVELAPGHAAIRFARGYGGDRIATVVGSDVLTGPIEAALANGVLAHADETDDSHAPSLSHPGCAVVPAALAVGEQLGIGGTHFLRAVALGYDVGPRVTMCLGIPALSRELHKSSHSIAGVFGAAAARRLRDELERGRCAGSSITAQQSSGIAARQRDSDHIEKAFVFGGMPAQRDVGAAGARRLDRHRRYPVRAGHLWLSAQCRCGGGHGKARRALRDHPHQHQEVVRRLAHPGAARCPGAAGETAPVRRRAGAEGDRAARHARSLGREQPRHPRYLSAADGRRHAGRRHRLVPRRARRGAHA